MQGFCDTMLTLQKHVCGFIPVVPKLTSMVRGHKHTEVKTNGGKKHER